uniref:Uncharacterized protein MANES_15G085200 n=1 Tax=Rhizophora mucronata TaxID=61149 RepID=A0A2P2QRT7_RHIMU
MASTLQFMVVFVIDFLAFLLALAAEQMRSTAKVVMDSGFNYTYCVYSSNISTILGIGASTLLLVSQVLTLRTSQYFCFAKSKSSGGRGACATIVSIISWITFFGAETFLLVGSVKNAQRTKFRTIFGMEYPDCQTLRKGAFETGAALILITSMTSKMNYVCCSNSEGDLETDNNGSNELGTYTSFN